MSIGVISEFIIILNLKATVLKISNEGSDRNCHPKDAIKIKTRNTHVHVVLAKFIYTPK